MTFNADQIKAVLVSRNDQLLEAAKTYLLNHPYEEVLNLIDTISWEAVHQEDSEKQIVMIFALIGMTSVALLIKDVKP